VAREKAVDQREAKGEEERARWKVESILHSPHALRSVGTRHCQVGGQRGWPNCGRDGQGEADQEREVEALRGTMHQRTASCNRL